MSGGVLVQTLSQRWAGVKETHDVFVLTQAVGSVRVSAADRIVWLECKLEGDDRGRPRDGTEGEC